MVTRTARLLTSKLKKVKSFLIAKALYFITSKNTKDFTGGGSLPLGAFWAFSPNTHLPPRYPFQRALGLRLPQEHEI